MIESLDNKKVKEVVKLKSKKYRDETGLFVACTYHLVYEAYKKGLLVEIFKIESFDVDISVPVTCVTNSVMNKMTDLVNCKIIGVCRKNICNNIVGEKILLLDNVQDPGNVGTILRSCLAFNVSSVVISSDSCDLYNEKVVRASEGAIFNLNVIRSDLKEIIYYLKDNKIPIYGTSVVDGVLPSDVSSNKYALIVGNEGSGVSPEILLLTDRNLYIKTNELSESLNVAVATSIILYEFDR